MGGRTMTALEISGAAGSAATPCEAVTVIAAPQQHLQQEWSEC